MTTLQKYLLTLLSTKKIERTVNYRLDYTKKDILLYIAGNPLSSIYDCQKYLNYSDYLPEDENVEVQIHNLIKLGLIQNVTTLDQKTKNSIEEDESVREKPKNSRICYSISSAGIFYLFKTNPEAINMELILSNKDDGLFINFLYPFLEFNTLQKIKHRRTLTHIIRLLNRCCETIQKELDILRSVDESGGETGTLEYVDGLATSEYCDRFYGLRGFLQNLKNGSKIKWLDIDNTKIIEIQKAKLFKIRDNKNNELILELYPERKVAMLSDKNQRIKKFSLKKDPYCYGTYNITYFNRIRIEDYIEKRFKDKHSYFDYKIDSYIFEFCRIMLEYMSDTSDEYNMITEEQRMTKRQDCIIIAKDKNFQEIVSSFKQNFDSRYDGYIKLNNVQQV
jgi:hypothetical protein